ncbi:MAG: acyl-CoA dehydrogenase [Alphaproteobacteria bacterium]|nr:MAG: acyl-CoA dehydrogenase [Alphaproteobacteria bacterium]
MSESRTQLTEMADGLFAELRGQGFDAIWPRLEEAGFGLLLLPETEGGFGGDFGDLAAVMRLAGFHALAAPLGEHVLTQWLLNEGGLGGEGFTALASGLNSPVPWGRHADRVLVPAEGRTFLARGTVTEGASPVGEPRDVITFEMDSAESLDIEANLLGLVAFLRVCQTAGALDAALALAVDYCSQRVQFGRTLSQFQAVQHSIALLASEAAAVNCAATGVAEALDRGDADFEIAAAKLRTNTAIKTGCALAHQVHGAIGFTQEYPLNELTRRMMGWRSEGGNDAYWSARIGGQAIAWGSESLWDELTRRTDPKS